MTIKMGANGSKRPGKMEITGESFWHIKRECLLQLHPFENEVMYIFLGEDIIHNNLLSDNIAISCHVLFLVNCVITLPQSAGINLPC